MRCPVVSGEEASDIDEQVLKILRGLGNPEPPLNLDDVRQLLRLDRQFYSTTDAGMFRELVSRIRLGTMQVLERPILLWDAIRRFEIAALWLPDQRRIMVDKDQPKLKWRWNEVHEIGHSIIPWHQSFLHGDDHGTLRFSCHETIEAEANYAAGKLLFMQDCFKHRARSTKSSFASVQALSKEFENTLTSTLWRYVEESDVPKVAIITQHPKHLDANFDSTFPCKHLIGSPDYWRQFF
jgi:hypothetical protein